MHGHLPSDFRTRKNCDLDKIAYHITHRVPSWILGHTHDRRAHQLSHHSHCQSTPCDSTVLLAHTRDKVHPCNLNDIYQNNFFRSSHGPEFLSGQPACPIFLGYGPVKKNLTELQMRAVVNKNKPQVKPTFRCQCRLPRIGICTGIYPRILYSPKIKSFNL